ncbi:MAG TPA: hypothetical protein VHQ47_10930 [Phycisphaerae bacterium]|nr:hypothetical protein [Phycisphaerae bacterium]
MIQSLFTVLIVVQGVVNVVHDWLHIPGWTHGRQVRATLGMPKMVAGTVITAALGGVAVAFALCYWHKPKPLFVLIYWSFYCAFTVMGAIAAWWVPYFRGADEKTMELYRKMYAGTYQVLPARGDNPRANLLHICFHALFVVNLVLAGILWTGVS